LHRHGGWGEAQAGKGVFPLCRKGVCLEKKDNYVHEREETGRFTSLTLHGRVEINQSRPEKRACFKGVIRFSKKKKKEETEGRVALFHSRG